MTTTSDLLARVAAKLGKKPEEIWPGWYAPGLKCKACGFVGVRPRFIQKSDVDFCLNCSQHNRRLRTSVDAWLHTGPDLHDPRNLNDALGVLRVATGDEGFMLWFCPIRDKGCRYELELTDTHHEECLGSEPTAAVIAAIEEACK